MLNSLLLCVRLEVLRSQVMLRLLLHGLRLAALHSLLCLWEMQS